METKHEPTHEDANGKHHLICKPGVGVGVTHWTCRLEKQPIVEAAQVELEAVPARQGGVQPLHDPVTPMQLPFADNARWRNTHVYPPLVDFCTPSGNRTRHPRQPFLDVTTTTTTTTRTNNTTQSRVVLLLGSGLVVVASTLPP